MTQGVDLPLLCAFCMCVFLDGGGQGEGETFVCVCVCVCFLRFERSTNVPLFSLVDVMKRLLGRVAFGEEARVRAGQMWAPCKVLSATDGETPPGIAVNIWKGLSVGWREVPNELDLSSPAPYKHTHTDLGPQEHTPFSLA